jgi:hypothetical protein
MTAYTFLVLNLAVAFYDVGTIWAHEVDIFRSWRLIDGKDFHTVQRVHWRKLPYWVLTPFGLALAGAVGLVFYQPTASPLWAAWVNLACQVAALVSTGMFWGRWQAKLSRDPAGPRSRYLDTILRTHWVRTLLVSAAALNLMIWTLLAH